MKISRRESIAGFVFALPSLAGFMLFFLIPFFISLYYCFTQGIGGAKFVGLSNFTSLLGSSSFILAIKNTLFFNGISVPLILFLSLLLALLLNSKLKGFIYFRTFLIMPLVIPVASVVLVWNILFEQYGFLNKILLDNGFMPVEWMRSDWSVLVLILLYLWKNIGYNVILFLAGLSNIPVEYYESAGIDGAGSFLCFRKITLPFLVPTGFFILIISMINSFKVFREAYLLAGSYPHTRIYMLQHFMNNNFFSLSYPRLTTAAFLMAAFVFILVFLFFKIEARMARNL